MSINVEDFIPVYQYGDVYSKKEFRELELDKRETIGSGLLKHQKLVARLLSPYTPYDELYLFHLPGSGKSCSSIGTIELALKQMPDVFKKAVVILPNAELLKKFLYEIVYTCSDGHYKPDESKLEGDDLRPTDPRQIHAWRMRMAKKATAGTYQLYTHESFYNQVLSNSTLTQLKNQFNNTIIVIDEVHRLIDSVVYESYWSFLHALDNRKILLLSGTPMKNEYEEISPLMNLIMPENQQLPSRPTVEDIETCRGRVSFLRSNTGIQTEYIGRVLPPMEFLKLYYSRMSEFQYSVYSRVYRSEPRGLRPESISASMFVFPNRMYGKEGFNYYVRRSRRGNYSITDDFTSSFRGDYQNRLRILSEFSSKYAEVIRHILNHPQQNVFVYCENIKGSGAVMLGYCLEQFGYSRFRGGGRMRKAARYAILSPTLEDNGSLESILSSFNQKSNRNGEFVQVLIGGAAIAEGFTFRSVQQIHILQPHWNLSTLDQVVARGVRLGAHRFLGEGVPVSIYRHVAVHPSQSPTIDVQIYKIAEDKDIQIKQTERILKEISLDCQLTLKRNIVQGDIRECDYSSCEYKCSYPDWSVMKYDTYLQYYLPESEVVNSSNAITTELRERGTYDIDEKTSDVDYRAIRGLLHNMLDTSLGRRWINYSRGRLYLAPTARSQDSTDVYYSLNPYVKPTPRFQYYMELQLSQIAQQKIRTVIGYPLEERMVMLSKLPSFIIGYFIERSVDAGLGASEMVDTILEQYQNYIHRLGDEVFVAADANRLRKRTGNGRWQDASDDDKHDLLSKYTRNNPHKVFGRLSGDKLTIVDLTKEKNLERLLLAGKSCRSYTKSDQLALLRRLGIEDTGRTNEERCDILQNWFLEQDIIFHEGI
jgi:hypothetical protein